jgi:hypothetical protein
MLRRLSVGRFRRDGEVSSVDGAAYAADADIATWSSASAIRATSSGSNQTPPPVPDLPRVRNTTVRSEDHKDKTTDRVVVVVAATAAVAAAVDSVTTSVLDERSLELDLTLVAMKEHLDGLHLRIACHVNDMIKFSGRCKLPAEQHPLGDHLMDHAAARASQRKAVSTHSRAWLAAVAMDEVAQLIVDHELGILSGIAETEHHRMRPKIARRVHELRGDTAETQELLCRVGGIDEIHLHRAIERLDAEMCKCDID